MEPLFLIPEQTLGQTFLCIVRLCVKCAELSTHQNNHVLCSNYLILTRFVLCILLVCVISNHIIIYGLIGYIVYYFDSGLQSITGVFLVCWLRDLCGLFIAMLSYI